MSLDAHFKELSDDIFFMTYNPYFVDQNYKSKFDTKKEVTLYKGMEGVHGNVNSSRCQRVGSFVCKARQFIQKELLVG